MRKPHCLLLFAMLCILSIHTAKAQNSALNFDGTNDYVDYGNSSLFNPNSIKTMECWIKFNSLTGEQEIISKSIGGQGIELLIWNNGLSAFCMFDGSNYSYLNYPVSNLQTGIWYHVAFSWNGTKESMKLYVNGKDVNAARTDGGNINNTGLTNPAGSVLKVGNWSDPVNRYLNGTVDEVRIWSVNRTATQVKDGMYGTVDPNTSGLTAYYRYNEGSGTTSSNSTSSAGTTGTVYGGATWPVSPVQRSSNALHFDGTNDQVNIAPNSLFDFTQGTIECWVRPGSLTGNACMVGVRGSTSARWSFHMSTTNNTIGIYNGASYTTLPYTIVQGQWIHLAFVNNGTNVTLYVNGTQIGTYNVAFGTALGQPLDIGVAKYNGGDMEHFLGDIDEVRLWNTVRTQSEIQNNKDVTLTGTETGLVALYSFNQGIDGGNNAGLVTAIDGTTNNNHGRLSNLALSGFSSNWSSHALATLPVRLLSFSAEKNNDKVNLRWRTGEEINSKEFVIERSTDGLQFKSIGTVHSAGTSNYVNTYSFNDNNPIVGTNYYRLKQVDKDGKFTYSQVKSIQFAVTQKLYVSQAGQGTINVRLQNGTTEKCKVVDMSGRVVFNGSLINGQAVISNLITATYSVSVQTRNGVYTQKVAVQ